MILDGLLTFTGSANGNAGSPASGAWTDFLNTGTNVASNVVDLGITSGVPSSANGGGARDIGVGDDPMLKLSAICTTAFTGGTSLQLTLSGAPDDGTGAPGTYTPMWTSEVYLEANLTIGTQIANIDVPRPVPGQPLPRFLQLTYINVGTHTAGGIEAQIVIDRDDQIIGATGAYSGYVAGVTVAN
jgi:hypothetical protein